MAELVIRTATLADLETVKGILAECQRLLLAEGIRQWADQYPTEGDIRAGVEAGMTYLLLREGDPVATLAVEQDTPPQVRLLPWLTAPPQRFLMVHRLAVLPRHRGRGYAKHLMGFVEHLALAERCGSVRLGVYSDNPAALGLYEGLGYQRIGEVVMPYREKPFICMEKLLGPAARPR